MYITETCTKLKIPIPQSSSDSPNGVGMSFAANMHLQKKSAEHNDTSGVCHLIHNFVYRTE